QAEGREPQPAQAGVTASVEIEDLYEILGVEPDADAAAIKRAYRKLAQQHHPDHSEADDAEAVFDRIAKAYSVLGDARRRDWYDRMRTGDLVA
ncbi:MAG: J domain-containing protein, partial [Planctomycetota bacterium]